jgi:hypothetical protein
VPKNRDHEATEHLESQPTDLDVPPIEDDEEAGEATVIDSKPVVKGPFEDDEATKFTGTPKKARATQRVLEESKKLAARGPTPEPARRVHPLVALSIAFVMLAALLWAISWMLSSSG